MGFELKWVSLAFLLIICSHRFSIKGRLYPAILPVENKKVTGKVCLDTSILFFSPNSKLHEKNKIKKNIVLYIYITLLSGNCNRIKRPQVRFPYNFLYIFIDSLVG